MYKYPIHYCACQHCCVCTTYDDRRRTYDRHHAKTTHTHTRPRFTHRRGKDSKFTLIAFVRMYVQIPLYFNSTLHTKLSTKFITYLDFASTLMAYSLSDISDSELAPCPMPCRPPHSSSDETSSPEEDLGPVEDSGTDNIPNVRRGFRRWSRSAAMGGGCSASSDVLVFRHCKRYCMDQRGMQHRQILRLSFVSACSPQHFPL